MRRPLRWALSNGIFSTCLYFGFVGGVDGARNLAVFWVWFGGVMSLATLITAVSENMQKKGPSVPAWLDGTFDAAMVAFLAWHGQTLLAAVYLTHTVLIHSTFAAKPEAAA